jgi:transcriptional regulator with XRE-family HTH domain
MKRDTHHNIVGPVVQHLRKQRGWSQAKLAERLQDAGWKISRSGLAKIECRVVWVGDFELLYFVNVLGVRIGDLFPHHSRKVLVETMIAKPSSTSESECRTSLKLRDSARSNAE